MPFPFYFDKRKATWQLLFTKKELKDAVNPSNAIFARDST